jgi:hypothetical protein
MSPTARLSVAFLFLVGFVSAQDAHTLAVGDNASWATVGALLTGLCYATAKLLDKR